MMFFLLLALSAVNPVYSLRCTPCENTRCSDSEPVCCESGFLLRDECRCCYTKCAKNIGETCGGWWTEGDCGPGLRCLKTCECRTKHSSKECIFPFKYKGKIYTKCTRAKSKYGKFRCATKVDNRTMEAIGPLEECSEGSCDDRCTHTTQNFGRCIDANTADHILLQLKRQNTTVTIDKVDRDRKPTKKCSSLMRKKDFCRCAAKTSGKVRGGCMNKDKKRDSGSYGDGDSYESYGYCYLENIQDPTKPTKNCFNDAAWSSANGQFYSYKACDLSY